MRKGEKGAVRLPKILVLTIDPPLWQDYEPYGDEVSDLPFVMLEGREGNAL